MSQTGGIEPTSSEKTTVDTSVALGFYGETLDEQEKKLGNEIQQQFANAFHQEDLLIHKYYVCIHPDDKARMSKDNKFQHKWLFDTSVARCPETGI